MTYAFLQDFQRSVQTLNLKDFFQLLHVSNATMVNTSQIKFPLGWNPGYSAASFLVPQNRAMRIQNFNDGNRYPTFCQRCQFRQLFSKYRVSTVSRKIRTFSALPTLFQLTSMNQCFLMDGVDIFDDVTQNTNYHRILKYTHQTCLICIHICRCATSVKGIIICKLSATRLR